MYHTKMYPKFLLLPKCSKIKSYRNPRIGKQRLQVTKKDKLHTTHQVILYNHFQDSFLSQSKIVLCACIKMYINILSHLFFFIKQINTFSTINITQGGT